MATKNQTATAAEAAATQTTDLATKQATDLAALNDMFAAEAGAGFEEATAASYAIPFLYVLQSGSPQCKKSDGAYIKGAEEGMLFNSVTKEIFSGEDGIVVIPCHYSHRFNEWKPRESGGGFVAEYLPGEQPISRKDEKNRDVLDNGNNLVDTRNHYVLIVKADGSFEPALMTMSSTQLKKSRQWMSVMQGIKMRRGDQIATAPMMSRQYRITTVPENNDQGSWFGLKIELEGIVQDTALFKAAMEFRDAVKTGAAQAKPDAAPQEASGHENDKEF